MQGVRRNRAIVGRVLIQAARVSDLEPVSVSNTIAKVPDEFEWRRSIDVVEVIEQVSQLKQRASVIGLVELICNCGFTTPLKKVFEVEIQLSAVRLFHGKGRNSLSGLHGWQEPVRRGVATDLECGTQGVVAIPKVLCA
jgi:hypothetical protein